MSSPPSPSPPGPPPSPAFLAQSRVPQILFGSIFPAIIATFFVLARFYSRTVLRKNWGWDDSWMLIAWLGGGVVLTVLNCVLTHYGAGRHEVLTTLPDLMKTGVLAVTCRLLYTVCLLWTKLSICALYLRLFIERKERIIIWGIVAFHVAFTIPIFFGLLFRCKPVQANWNLVIEGKCIGYTLFLYPSAILNILGDLALLAFIVAKLSTLRISSRQRTILIGVMGLGILVIIAAIVRLVRVMDELAMRELDVPYESYDIVIWTSVEINTGLVCAAAPAARPLLKKLAPWALLSDNEGREKEESTVDTKVRRENFADGTTVVSGSTKYWNSKSKSVTTESEADWIEMGRQMDLEAVGVKGDMVADSWMEMPADVGHLLSR